MKTIILAAGYATRLYPLTENTPKPLLEIKNKPIIEYLIEKINNMTLVDEIIVVTNQKFFQHFLDWQVSYSSTKKITIVNDQTKNNNDRLGSLGDIKYVVEILNLNDDILVVAGDNLFEFELSEIEKEYNSKPLIALYDVKDKELAKLYGIVSINDSKRIVDFEEKPQEPKSTLSSTGIYFYPKETVKKLLHFVDVHGKQDKAGDFLEWLYQKEDVYGYIAKKKWFDIGSLEQLEKARQEFQS